MRKITTTAVLHKDEIYYDQGYNDIGVVIATKWRHYLLPRRDFTQKAKSRGGTLVTLAYVKGYLQLKHTVIIPEKISISLNRGCEESTGNDDLSIVCARKYEIVRMTLRQKIRSSSFRDKQKGAESQDLE